MSDLPWPVLWLVSEKPGFSIIGITEVCIVLESQQGSTDDRCVALLASKDPGLQLLVLALAHCFESKLFIISFALMPRLGISNNKRKLRSREAEHMLCSDV
jgi:hypothetical protein